MKKIVISKKSESAADSRGTMQQEIVRKVFPEEEISMMLKQIQNCIIETSPHINSANFDSISSQDLELMFQLYDENFLNNFFRNRPGAKIKFRMSRRMTSSGGKTTKSRKNGKVEYEICLSSVLLFNAFQNGRKSVVVNGVECNSRLEAALRIMEHEIIHLLEMMIFNESSCGKRRFKLIAGNLFGHRDVKHQLRARRETTQTELNLKAGDYVKFKFKEVTKRGQIIRITRRATVMVKDCRGQYADEEGTRFSKYYVPLYCIELSKPPGSTYSKR